MRESKQSSKGQSGFVSLEDMGHVIRRQFTPLFLLCLIPAALFAQAQRAPAAKAAASAPKPEEPQLPHEIRHQLSVLPYYSVFDYIAFRLDGTSVTLTGFVLRPTLRANAEAAVKSLEGVSSVKNLIEVLPKSPMDDDTRRAVYRAIFEDSTLQKYAVSDVPVVHIILRNGEVTLEGAVATDAEKNLASTRASSVSGVSAVKNNLSVHPKGAAAN